jgi:RHS repeat-associated protein
MSPNPEAALPDLALPAGQAPSAIGRSQGTFAVDPNGQATYHIPIEVPPGIAGCQPRLELLYNHRQSNGFLGVGWNLSGLSAITRSRATYAVDGFNGAIDYDTNDRFSLDGQRLINVEGEYGAPGALYYTELQSWNHVRAGQAPDEGFTVVRKNGEVWHYGTTADSRILAAGGSGVRVWALSSATDLNGNRVEYSYTQPPLGNRENIEDEGAYYIDRISYTAHKEMEGNRFVQFSYEARPDPISDYIGGHPVVMAYRLQQIIISLAGDTPVRSYEMSYRLSTATQLSCLESVAESGADGVSTLPPTQMVWQDVEGDSPGFDIGPQSQLVQHLNQLGVQQMDVGGSGRTDIVQLWIDQNGELNATTYLATPSLEGPTYVHAADNLLGGFPAAREILPMDVNGDGRTDLVIAYKGSNGHLKLAVFVSNGSGFDPAPASPLDTGDSWYDTAHLKFFAMDANGDGRTDLVEAYSHHDPNLGDQLYFRAYLSKFGDGSGQMFTDQIITPTDDPATPTEEAAFWAMDVNGDGMMDLVRVWKRGTDDHIVATAYVSVSKGLYDVTFAGQVVSDLGTFSLATTKAFLPVDVTGNGIQGLLHVWQEAGNQGTTLHLTTFLCDAAGGFVAGQDTPFLNQTLGEFYPMGFNGGGLISLVNKWISGRDELMFTVFSSTPSGTFWEGPTFQAGTAGSAVKMAKFFPGDANGDGKADLIRMSLDPNKQVLVLPYISSGPYPDLVTTITNPLGGAVTIDYRPLSDLQVYNQADDDDHVFPKGFGRRYPNPLTPAQFPAQAVLGQATYVVSRYAQKANVDLNRFDYLSTYAMSYSGARLDMLGRGWEGFRTVRKLDLMNGRITDQTYNQDFPYTGTVASTRTEADGRYATDPRVPKDQSAMLLSINSSDFQSFTRATGATGLKRPVVEVLMTASRLERYDYGEDHFDYALGKRYGYDDYGNQTARVEVGYVNQSGDPLFPTEIVHRYNLYQNDILADGWALGFLRYAKVTANAVDPDITQFLSGDYHLEQKAYVATTYNLESQGRWDDVHGKYLLIAYEYDDFGNRITETRPGGLVARYEYEPDYNTFRMRMTSPPDDQGVRLVAEYGYDPRFGVEVAQRDASGNITITGLDVFGRKALRQGPVPDITGAVSDPNALTALVTGSTDLRAAFLGAAVVTREITKYLNDGQAGLYTEVQALQKFPVDSTRAFIWKQSYLDGLAREREKVSQSGQSGGNILIVTDYDADDKPILQSLPFFSPTSVAPQTPHLIVYTYDVLGQPLTRRTPAGSNGDESTITTWEYGSAGMVTMTSAAGSQTPYVQVFEHHFYDGEDKIRRAVVPGDNNATTKFDFDPIARLTKATDPPTPTNPEGVSNIITYDSLDRRLTFDNPDQNTTNDPNVKAMTYEYDPVSGLLQQQTDSGGQVTAFDYDQLERVKTRALGDRRIFHYAYDDPASNGQARLTQVKIEAADKSIESQHDFSYDKYGNISQTTLIVAGETAPFLTSSTFDPQLRMVEQTMPDGSVLAREYSFGQLTSQSLDGARADYPLEEYEANGRAGKLIYGEGVVIDYAYNPTGQVYEEVVTGGRGEVLKLSYQYDLLGQILAIANDDGSGNDQTQAFTYLNKRLQSAAVPGFDPAAYDYDLSGNLTTKEGVSYTYQAHFPLSGTANGQLVYSATPDACGRTKTRSTGGQELTFDYDGLGSLRRVATSNNETLREMISDFAGRRLLQTDADGTKVLYVNAAYNVTRPVDGTASVTKYLLDDKGAVASITTGPAKAILYFRLDHKGSTTDTFGPDGTLLSRIAYSGYGQMKLLTGPDNFQPKYEHRQWDAAIGLYYFGARYYDPVTGRFLTPDSRLGGDNYLQADVLNRYSFELNNPVNFSDPTGHMASWVAGLLIGLTILAVGVLIVATAGTAAPIVGVLGATGASLFASVLGGAFIAAGASATAYSVTHTHDDFSWKDYGIQTSISFGVGAVSGGLFFGLSSGVSVLATASFRTGASIIGSGLISGASDVAGQALTNVAEGHKASDGLVAAAVFGVAFGMAGGWVANKFAGPVEEALTENTPLVRFNNAATQYTDGLLNSEAAAADLSQVRRAVDARALANLRKAMLIQAIFANATTIPEEAIENAMG